MFVEIKDNRPLSQKTKSLFQSMIFWKGRSKGVIHTRNIELDDFPENLIQSELKTMVDNAKSHKFHKQYEQSDMNQFQEKEIDEETEKYKNRWTVLKTILRGISR